MKKNLSIIIGLFLLVSLSSGGCSFLGVQTQTNQNQLQEGPPPDYTSIDAALQDPSPIVRIQAIEALKNIKHKTAINKLIKTTYNNADNKDVSSAITKALITYGKDVIEPIKTSIWIDKSFDVQKVAFDVLSGVEEPPEFYKEVCTKFSNIPSTEQSSKLRISMATFLITKYTKEKEFALPKIILLLSDSDKELTNIVIRRISDWKDPNAVKYLENLYLENRNNYPVVLNILKVMNTYPPLSDKNSNVPVDISIFLNTFGSYDKKVQEQSYLGLKNFGFNDKDGRMLKFLKRFENCDIDTIRANAFELIQVLQNRKLPPDKPEPQFIEPASQRKDEFCY